MTNVILKGNVCYSKTPQELYIHDGSYVVCQDGVSKGVFSEIPAEYASYPAEDCGDSIIIPGLCDIHTHAPQYTYRALGMDKELLDWLNTYTYPEEAKYSSLEYADKAYTQFIDAVLRSATTRLCIYATAHNPATIMLMEKLESSGVVSYVGVVNMDRNCPETVCSKSSEAAYTSTKEWIEDTKDRFSNTKPILTPRFIPVCSGNLMRRLKELQEQYSLPVQSHLSENKAEIQWVKELCPSSLSYAHAYDGFGLFGGSGTPTIMAHCVWCSDEEKELIAKNGVYIAHCPQSNTNIASGIAPIREYMDRGLHVGLGSDVAGGCHLSIFRAMSDAIQVSKLYYRYICNDNAPLTLDEAFYLGTVGGGSFFGKVGSFDEGYEFDAVVLDDSGISTVSRLTTHERLERIVYLGNDDCVIQKYIRGQKIWKNK